MLRRGAPTKATGGGGYTFADKVAAGFLAQMLMRKFPLEPEFGPIAEGHLETRCAVSVKSNRQLTKDGFNSEFVQDAWGQWQGAAGSNFDPATDFVGLIVGVIDDRTLHQWRELQKQATSTRSVARVVFTNRHISRHCSS